MSLSLPEQVVNTFGLTDIQRQAALERGRDVVVTAGAGSGKTRTLVARYASLLAEGLDPRRVVAITFTEKAAREMRSRVRDAIARLAQSTQRDEERQRWIRVSAGMDSARIGTIHGLCAEILRAHPAEAGIDPRFDVLDEGLTSALKAQVVEDTLNTLVDDPAYLPLFAILGTRDLSSLMHYLLQNRLEAGEAFTKQTDSSGIVLNYLRKILTESDLSDAISELRGFSKAQLETDKLYEQVADLLIVWEKAEKALHQGNTFQCAAELYQARREYMRLNKGRNGSRSKDLLKSVQQLYDELLDKVVGGNKTETQPDAESEKRHQVFIPLVGKAFAQLMMNYQAALDQRQALDFDDLESGAERLLKREDVRSKWQDELDAVLVDEFQDTNARQLNIVCALAGQRGRLFIVGDDRQSIYRFRRADVRVFRRFKQRVNAEGGLVCDLDRTYRAHEPLLFVIGDLLKEIMGDQEDATRPYYVPFSQLDAYYKEAPVHLRTPHVELVLGVGDDAASARPVMAKALAYRLLELKAEKQIQSWDEVALLFRASTAYSYYEDAFEDMDIPFVTVAGRGFYDRPEVRDLLNILKALANPSDDLAMAGLMRSPAFGLTDAALYLLRIQAGEVTPYWQAIQNDASFLSELDQQRVLRTGEILRHLLPQVDRIPVSELLKQLVDATDYRAILASAGEGNSSGRLWRNVDKLLADAHASGQVNVRSFLEYLNTLSDAGAREGEAPADALGAVRLMTIHKSKGLEFPVVVLADAGHKDVSRSSLAYLYSETGLVVKLEPAPMAYRYAKWQDGLQDEAESLRILYVALTRAKDKLIVSGHSTSRSNSEWLNGLIQGSRINQQKLLEQAGSPLVGQTISGHPVRAIAYATTRETENIFVDMLETADVGVSADTPLHTSLVVPQPLSETLEEADSHHAWRATADENHVPPSVIGQMVHKAIELWMFPGNPHLVAILETVALNAGLASTRQKGQATRRAIELLERFHAHPLWMEIDSAAERYHEVPYSRMVGERAETGYIDLLYRDRAGWHLVDFKTDSIQSTDERRKLVTFYGQQMNRYFRALNSLIGQPVQTNICFLDDRSSLNLVTA